jgi:hypothetical protein
MVAAFRGATLLHQHGGMGCAVRSLTALVLALFLLALASPSLAGAAAELRSGTIVLGVPRAQFVVVGADRLWTKVLPKSGDAPWERQDRRMKIALHGSLPLAVAVAGLATLGPAQDTVGYVRELITPLDAPSLTFDTIVERLRQPLQRSLREVRDPATRALAANPVDAEAKIRLKAARVTLLVAYVADGRATLGWVQLDDAWKTGRASPPRGVAAWPDALDAFYRRGALAGAAALFGASIQEPATLAEHVRAVIEAGIREDARLNQDRDRHVGGPVDVVLIDTRGARCVPPCAPPDPR